MCYNCGCQIPNDPMGKGHVHEGGGSLTEDSLKHIGKVWGMDTKEVKKNVYQLLKKELEKDK